MRNRRICTIFILGVVMFLFYQVTLPRVYPEKRIPNFAVYDVQGKRHVFYDILNTLPENGILILNFTSIHCSPCKKEIPELLRIVNEMKTCRLMCVYTEVGSEALKSAEELGVSKQAFVDPFGSIRMKIFQEDAIKIPTTILVDKNTSIINTFNGYNSENIESIKEYIEKHK